MAAEQPRKPLKIISAKDYKVSTRKIVVLPSTAVFRIKKMPPRVLAQVLALTGAGMTEEEIGEKMQENLMELLDIVLPECVIEPQIVGQGAEANDDQLSINDLGMGDAQALLMQIMDHSGFSQEDMDELQSFRRKQLRDQSDVGSD